MHTLSRQACILVRGVDRAARGILNLGRSTGTIRPYIIKKRNTGQIVILDSELLERFLIFCSRLDEYGLTDTEMLLFLIKSSTETNTGIKETERELVFEKLSDEILNLVEGNATTEKSITEEWRTDSEINRTKDGLC